MREVCCSWQGLVGRGSLGTTNYARLTTGAVKHAGAAAEAHMLVLAAAQTVIKPTH